MTLVFEGPVTYLSKPVEEHRLCQRVPGFALVETGSHTTPQRWIFEPSQHEESSLDSPDLAQSKGKAVLTRIVAKLAENRDAVTVPCWMDAASRRPSPSCCSMIFVLMAIMELSAGYCAGLLEEGYLTCERARTRHDGKSLSATARLGAVSISCGSDGVFTDFDVFDWSISPKAGSPRRVAEFSLRTTWMGGNLVDYRDSRTRSFYGQRRHPVRGVLSPSSLISTATTSS